LAQKLQASNGLGLSFDTSTPSRQRRLMANNGLPSRVSPRLNDPMPDGERQGRTFLPSYPSRIRNECSETIRTTGKFILRRSRIR
jgi:hypothetical protein